MSYCNFKGTGDLWSLIAPPPGGPRTFGWRTTVCADWVARTIGLYWDLSFVAPNTKLLGATVRRALKLMLDDRSLVISSGKEPADVIDKIDTTVRIVFGMLRTLKTQGDEKKKCFRQLSAADAARIDLALANPRLPADYINEDEEDDDINTIEHKSSVLALTDKETTRSTRSNTSQADVFARINSMSFTAPQAFTAPQITAPDSPSLILGSVYLYLYFVSC